jgi:hypothetical protein
MTQKDVGNLDPIAIKYLKDGERIQLGKGFEDYFHNSDDKICPVKSCKLLNAGCQSQMRNNENVKISKEEPWTIDYSQNTKFGYD